MGISRREVLKTGIATVAVSGLPSLTAAQERRPNIVWIVCHDIHAALLGCYGNTLAKTAAIDGLAQDGILFKNAFTIAPVCSPSRFALVTGLYPSTCAPAHQMRAAGVLPPSFKPLPVLMRQAGYYCTNNFMTDYNMAENQQALWDACDKKAHWRNRPAGLPFFSVYNYSITHESHIFGHAPTTTDPHQVHVPTFLPDKPEVRQVLARNIDMVNRQDVATAHLLSELREDGLEDNTFVFFVADHGGVHPRSKRYCYDDGLHVPLIVRVPRAYRDVAGLPLGRPSDELISHVDMAPTVLSIAGVEIPSTMMGQPFMGKKRAPAREFAFSMRDRMDERYDLMYSVRDKQYRYIRNYMPQRIYGQHEAFEWQSDAYQAWERAHLDGELDGPSAAFWNPKPNEELYDMTADPHSVVNLAGDAKHHAQLAKMRQALEDFLISNHDNGLIPENAKAEGYEASRVEGAYPIKEVLATANLTTERNARNIPSFVRGLEQPNDILRFWNAHGLVLAAPLAGDTLAQVRQRLKTEKIDFVRCEMAEALIASGDTDAARDAMVEIALDDPNLKVRVRALDVISLLPDEKLAAIREQIARAGETKDEYIGDLTRTLIVRADKKYEPGFSAFPGFGLGERGAQQPQSGLSSDPDV